MDHICLSGVGRIPVNNFVSCSLDGVGIEFQAAAYGWMRVDHPVCPIHPYLEGSTAVESSRPIRDGDHGRIRQPGLG
jgi:hypothetical protein